MTTLIKLKQRTLGNLHCSDCLSVGQQNHFFFPNKFVLVLEGKLSKGKCECRRNYENAHVWVGAVIVRVERESEAVKEREMGSFLSDWEVEDGRRRVGFLNSESVKKKKKSARESEGEEEQRRKSARRSEVRRRDSGSRGSWRAGEEEQVWNTKIGSGSRRTLQERMMWPRRWYIQDELKVRDCN